jgi:hypothetical protein
VNRRPVRPAAARVASPAPAFALLVLAAALAWASPARSATYKWVDEKGVVHYTDKLPAEMANKGGTMLDKQARPVKKIDPAPTPEQVRAREVEDEQRRLLAKANEEVARRDRALVSSYTTEAEIDLARSRALGTIDAQIDSSSAYLQQLGKRKEELGKRRASLDGKPLPAALEREIEGTESELEKTAAFLDGKKKERVAVVARYDADRARWRELKAIADANAAATSAAAGASGKSSPAVGTNTSARK